MNIEEMVKGLIGQATQEEKEVFDKVVRSDDEKVKEELGHTKEVVLMSLMGEWANRLDEKGE